MLDGRDLLIYMSIIHEGDWDKIYSELMLKKFDYPEEDVIKKISTLKCRVITILDNDYPENLKQIYKPPFVLYYYGRISLLYKQKKILGVVGPRKPSEYAINATKEIVSDISNDFIVASGLAYGIDTLAAQTVIDNNGSTIAVLGSGIDWCYPEENIDLYNQIKKNHLLISEYPNDTPPSPNRFPIRNRIVTGLSFGVFVPEVGLRSGTSITVSLAIEENRELFVVPHPIHSESLSNQLIHDGAHLVENGNDIRELMPQYEEKNLK